MTSPSHHITNTQLSGISNTSYSFSFQPLYHIVLCYGNRVITIRCKETEFFVFLSSLFSLAAFNITLFPLVFVEGTSSHISVSHTHCVLCPIACTHHTTLYFLLCLLKATALIRSHLSVLLTHSRRRECIIVSTIHIIPTPFSGFERLSPVHLRYLGPTAAPL